MRVKQRPLLYIETSVFGFCFDRKPYNTLRRQAAELLFKQIEDGVFRAVTSPLTTKELNRSAEPLRSQLLELVEHIEELALELCAGGEATRRIAVMGASPRSGATLTALTLARVMSRQRRIVVADLSFASPAIAMAASEQGAPGLAELVSGEASFGDIITRDRMSGAHLVGAGQG